MRKKILSLAAILATVFGFTACEELGDIDLVGHINLTASNPVGGEQAYADGTTINFKSAMCNVNIDSVYVETGEYSGTFDINAGTVFVGTTQNLISNDVADISFPLCGINLRDTSVASYAISCPVTDFGFFEYLNTTHVNTLITTGLTIGNELGNLFVVAVSDTSFYLGYSGSINISAFGAELSRVKGTVSNVEAIYVTVAQIEAIANMSAEERAAINLATYFPHITFNGEISSMRADIDAVMQALNNEAGE